MSSQLEDLGHFIKRVQSRHHRALDSRMMRLGISLVQWNALREIDRNPGSSAHALAELTFNSDQAFGALMSRLIRLEFVERHPGVGRANTHRLTKDGRKMLAKGGKVMEAVLTASFAPLRVEERAMLLGLLTKLLGGAG